ncbi:MAG: UDP-N-acetylmuramate--L-alanine ligase [Gemmatimonadota bacterium]
MSAPLIDRNDPRPIHFVGVGGAGMSALAELFARRGAIVGGCDAAAVEHEALERLGIHPLTGHDPVHVIGARALVFTSAIRPDHPELVAARAAGIPVVRRAEALGEAVNHGSLVAIAGTHGKTTTTVMTTAALATAGLHPTGLAGGRVSAWRGNLHPGSDDLFVVEADEYDRSFLALRPSVAVVTNVEADHLDIYQDLADISDTFQRFLGPATSVVLCADDTGATSLKPPTGAQVIRYGTQSPDARVRGTPSLLTDGRIAVAVEFDGECLGDVVLSVPGEHNVLNALAAISAGILIGASIEGLRPGLESFRGVDRRFQQLGTRSGITVVDDYAHHPTELRATIAAARAVFPGRRLVVAFQPHLYSRTRDFASAFADALAAADVVMLADIYPAREVPIAGVTADLIAIPLSGLGRRPTWTGPRSELAEAVARIAKPGDVVVTAGAGDITATGGELLQLLANQGA